MPLVSVCVPVYNVEQYIGRCIKSIQNQTLSDIEIIIVNDCTPDSSMLIVEEYAKTDSRIKVINHECNKGLMWARRTGYMVAKGNFVTFCDSDDWLPTNAIEKLYLKALESGVDIVCGTIMRADDNNLYGKIECKLPYTNDKIGAFKAILSRRISQNICSKLFKRELLQNYNYVAVDNCTQAEDAGALFQFVDNCLSIDTIKDVVYMYYTNEKSASFNITLRSIKNICEITKIRDSILSKYPVLKRQKNRYFTEILSKYRANECSKKMLIEYGLQEYMSWKYILLYLSLKDIIKYMVKYILHLFKIRPFTTIR